LDSSILVISRLKNGIAALANKFLPFEEVGGSNSKAVSVGKVGENEDP